VILSGKKDRLTSDPPLALLDTEESLQGAL